MSAARTPSALQFRAQGGGQDLEAMRDSLVLASSRDLDWNGIVAESGRSRVFEPTDAAMAGHYLAINLDDMPLMMEARIGRDFTRVTLPPGGFWVSPADAAFSVRILRESHYGGVEIALPKVRRLLGRDLDLRVQFGLLDEPLEEVVRALLAEVARGGISGPLFADGLCTAILGRLARLFGGRADAATATDATTAAARPGLSACRLARVQDAIEAGLARRLSVEELARVAGLSVAHFARAFKQRTHESPHAFVMRRRVERACEALAAGHSIADAAQRFGFHDQAHLSRSVKQRIGVTPGAIVRARAR